MSVSLRFIPVAVPLEEGENVPADDDAIASVEDRVMVRRFVRSLSHEARLVVWAIFWEDRSQAEAARLLGMHPRTLSRVLERVLQRGREVMYEAPLRITA